MPPKKIEEPIGEVLNFGAKKVKKTEKKVKDKPIVLNLKEIKPEEIPVEHLLVVLPDKFLIYWGVPSLNRVISFDATLQCEPIFNDREIIYAEKSCVHLKKLDPRFNDCTLDIDKEKLFIDDIVLDEDGVEKLLLSPKGEYLVTLSRYRGVEQKGNLAIWERASGKELWRGVHREHMNGQSWPNIVMFYTRRAKQPSSEESKNGKESFTITTPQEIEEPEITPEEEKSENPYADSERIAILTLKQDIIFLMRKEDGALEQFKVYRKKKVRFWSMGSRGHFAVYADGKPGGVYLYDEQSNFKKPLGQIPFVTVENCEIKWNKQGDQVLILTSAATDDSSYYGTSRLYLMNGKGSYQNAVNVESPIHDVVWSPKGNEFIAVFGKTPKCKATLYNQRGQSLYDLNSTGARNTVAWGPHGNVFCLAGIRTMQGRMEFWMRDRKKMFGLGQASEASVISWSPSGLYFCSATVSPVMNVDNKIQIFKYNGVLKTTKTFDVKDSALYHAVWQSLTYSRFPDVRPSPRGMQEGLSLQKVQQDTAGKYIPPHLRK